MPDLITDLDEIKRLAQARQDEFSVMRHMIDLADDKTDAEVDALVDEIAAPIIDAIDCMQCANCCRSLNVYLTPDDAQRLADGIDVPLDSLVDRYVDYESAQQVGEWGVFRQSPCALLDGKRCSVYAHRPETCRTYPALTPDFRWTIEDTLDGAGVCPIIYNVLDKLVRITDRW